MRTLFLVLLLGLCLKGAGQSFFGQTYALVVGISDYKTYRDLVYAHEDATRFSNFLAQVDSVKKENIILLIDSLATREAIHGGLKSLIARAEEGDRIIFY